MSSTAQASKRARVMRIGGFVALAYAALIIGGLYWLLDHARAPEMHCVYARDGVRTVCGPSAD